MRTSLLLILFFFQLKSFSQQKETLKEKVYNFEGKIGSSIPVFLWFTVKDSIATGQVKYLKSKSSMTIRVIGFMDEEGDLKLNEFLNGDTITGIFYGRMGIENFSGTWVSPKTRRGLSFNLKMKDTIINHTDIDLEPKNIAGYYNYCYSKEGALGNLIVSPPKKNSVVKLEFSNYSDAPDRNIAEFKTESILSSKNEIICKFEDACIFRIRFFKDFVIVTYVDNQRNCGFGNGADIDGVYIKKY